MKVYTFTDADILKVIEGDRSTQDWMYKELYSIMKPIVLRKFDKDDIIVEEIIQDSIMKLLGNIHKINHKAIPNYAKTVARNLCIDTLRVNNTTRKQKTYLSVLEDHGFSVTELEYTGAKLNGNNLYQWYDDEDIPYDTHNPDMVWGTIREAIEQLSPAYKAVFTMYYLDDMSHQEIGEALGVCSGSSKSNLHKARIKMRSILGTYENVIGGEVLT